MKNQHDTSGQQPEVLAGLAVAAKSDGKKPASEGLTASAATAPKPVKQADQVDAATKVLRQGATGHDEGAQAAIAKLPDRTKTGPARK